VLLARAILEVILIFAPILWVAGNVISCLPANIGHPSAAMKSWLARDGVIRGSIFGVLRDRRSLALSHQQMSHLAIQWGTEVVNSLSQDNICSLAGSRQLLVFGSSHPINKEKKFN